MSNLWSKVSLSDVDPAVVLERKEGLDKYIQVTTIVVVVVVVIVIVVVEYFQY